jgi:hypothetical protein
VGELFEIFQVPRASGGALHRTKMLEAAYPYLCVSEAHLYRKTLKFVICKIRLDSGHPLHDVHGAMARVQTEVRSFGELLWVRRVIWKLLGQEVTNPNVLGVDLREDTGKPR